MGTACKEKTIYPGDLTNNNDDYSAKIPGNNNQSGIATFLSPRNKFYDKYSLNIAQ